MDELRDMSVADNHTIVDLIETARNRIWLSRSLGVAERWSRLLAVLFLVLALVHLGVRSVPGQFPAFLAIALTVVFLRKAFAARPTVAKSAVLADKALGGKSILTTALQCLNRDSHSAAARIVIDQGKAAAAEMRERLGELQPGSRRPDFLWPVVVIAVSVLLLSSPGRNLAVRDIGTLSDPQGDGEGRIALENDDADGAATELRQALVRADTAAIGRDEDRDAEREESPHTRIQPTSSTAPGDAPTVIEALIDPVSAGAGAGDEAGRGRGIGGESVPVPPRQMASRTAIELQRTGVRTAGAGEGGSMLINADGPAVSGPLVLQAASPPTQNSAWTRMSPAEAALANRYISATERAGTGSDDEQ